MKKTEIFPFVFSELDFSNINNKNNFFPSIVNQLTNITNSDIGTFYSYASKELKMKYKIGRYDIPFFFKRSNEIISFIEECNEIVVILERRKDPFRDILLNPKMQSGIAVLFSAKNDKFGILFLNSLKVNYYNREKILLLDYFVKIIRRELA